MGAVKRGRPPKNNIRPKISDVAAQEEENVVL